MKNKITCETGLGEDIIKKDVFDREISICKEMFQKDKGCCWGKCKDCGVLLLLNKLCNGELIEDKKEVEKFKNNYLN